MKGRKPKPSSLKKLEGTYRADRANPSEPQPPVPDRAPYVPRHLNDDAKKEWRRIVKPLMDLGLYTELDYAALAMYCQAYGTWVHAVHKTEERGEVLKSKETENYYQNPWFHVANKAWDQMRKILAEFGLTPSSRSRLNIAPPDEEPSLAEMLFNMSVDEGGD